MKHPLFAKCGKGRSNYVLRLILAHIYGENG